MDLLFTYCTQKYLPTVHGNTYRISPRATWKVLTHALLPASPRGPPEDMIKKKISLTKVIHDYDITYCKCLSIAQLLKLILNKSIY
jgi:hypothetical protein